MKEKVRIFKPHTHAGKKLVPGPEGIEIEVDAGDAKFLKDHGVLDKPAPAAAASGVAKH